jgi:3-hydroxyacyl-[acyl-carrier-protein] dehydratase
LRTRIAMSSYDAPGYKLDNPPNQMDKPSNQPKLDFRPLIPHRAPMVFIDDVIEYGATVIRAARTVRKGDLFVENGELPDAALIECIAQTIAAGDAQHARSKNGRVRKGYLTGLTGLKFESRARVGERIEIEATCQRRMDGMGLFDATARVGSRILARGTFKLFVDIDYSGK